MKSLFRHSVAMLGGDVAAVHTPVAKQPDRSRSKDIHYLTITLVRGSDTKDSGEKEAWIY